MFDILKAFAQLDQPIRVSDSWCTRSRFSSSSCTTCVQACPEDAIRLGEEITISSSCTGCNACVAVCPTGVFEKVSSVDRKEFFSACARGSSQALDSVTQKLTKRHGTQAHLYPKRIPAEREQYLTTQDASHKLPFGDVTILDSCTLCDLCVDMCPTGALTQEGNLFFDMKACTDCNLCVEVCPSQSVACASVPSLLPSRKEPVQLTRFTKTTCTQCDAEDMCHEGICVPCRETTGGVARWMPSG